MAAYCASKSGVNALMEAVRAEVATLGIATTTVCPGWIRTPMTATLSLPMPGIMEVDDACQRIFGAIRQRKRFFAFPSGLAWQVRMLHWLPPAMSDYMIQRMVRRLSK
jgi:NAD(P)-dependent dehydrogenase (short-subunit alcohol dehydrogenase family)